VQVTSKHPQEHSCHLPKSNLSQDESLFNSKRFNKRAHPYQTTGSKVTDFCTKKVLFSHRVFQDDSKLFKMMIPKSYFPKNLAKFRQKIPLSRTFHKKHFFQRIHFTDQLAILKRNEKIAEGVLIPTLKMQILLG
jgi:hypothetical protein